MSLFRIEPFKPTNGLVKEAPYSSEYRHRLSKLTNQNKEELYSFIRTSLSEEQGFTIASKFGRASLAWHEVPLIYLYQIADGIEEHAAILLGLMVMDVLIADQRQWLCCKTVMRGRDIPTNYYWLKAA